MLLSPCRPLIKFCCSSVLWLNRILPVPYYATDTTRTIVMFFFKKNSILKHFDIFKHSVPLKYIHPNVFGRVFHTILSWVVLKHARADKQSRRGVKWGISHRWQLTPCTQTVRSNNTDIFKGTIIIIVTNTSWGIPHWFFYFLGLTWGQCPRGRVFQYRVGSGMGIL